MSDYSSPSPEDEVQGGNDQNISTDPATEEDTDSGGAPEEPDVTDPS